MKTDVVLDKRFAFAEDLNVGDKGQIIANLEIISERLISNDDNNDIKLMTLNVIGAEKTESTGKRLT